MQSSQTPGSSSRRGSRAQASAEPVARQLVLPEPSVDAAIADDSFELPSTAPRRYRRGSGVLAAQPVSETPQSTAVASVAAPESTGPAASTLGGSQQSPVPKRPRVDPSAAAVAAAAMGPPAQRPAAARNAAAAAAAAVLPLGADSQADSQGFVPVVVLRTPATGARVGAAAAALPSAAAMPPPSSLPPTSQRRSHPAGPAKAVAAAAAVPTVAAASERTSADATEASITPEQLSQLRGSQAEPATATQEAVLADDFVLPSPPPVFELPTPSRDRPTESAVRAEHGRAADWAERMRDFFAAIDKRPLIVDGAAPTAQNSRAAAA